MKQSEKLTNTVKFGTPEELSKLIAEGADIQLRDEYGHSALYSAYYLKRLDNAEILMSSGLDFADASEKMICGVYVQSEDLIRGAVDSGADPDFLYMSEYTALHEAAETGLTDSIRFLLDSGADIEARDKFGMTPLQLAAWQGITHSVKSLLEAGADINTEDNFKDNPLTVICGVEPPWEHAINVLSDERVECIKILISAGIELDHINGDGMTALDLAEENTYITAGNILRDHGALNSRYL